MHIISNCTQDDIKKAARALTEGHLVAFPTETVYGLGSDACNEKAVGRIYSVKGRPADHPVIVHISSITQMSRWAISIPEYAKKLAAAFWPGPMTLILKRSEIARNFITGSQNYVGLRVPNQLLALALLSEFEQLGGFGIAAPSANRFGAVSPTRAEAVVEEIGDKLLPTDLILDGGQCLIGIESTIIDCTVDIPVMLRPGAVTAEMIEKITNYKSVTMSEQSDVKVSGSFTSHYSPKARVEIGTTAGTGDGFIAMASSLNPVGVIRLLSPESIEEYARGFYLALRKGDELGLRRIVVFPPAGAGLSLAIRDRVEKAAGGNVANR